MFGEGSVHGKTNQIAQLTYELFFLLSMGLNFITEYVYMGPDGDPQPIRDLSKIAKNYRDNGSFYIDFITLLPLYHITKDFDDHWKIVNLIKVARLYLSLKHFNVTEILKGIKRAM